MTCVYGRTLISRPTADMRIGGFNAKNDKKPVKSED